MRDFVERLLRRGEMRVIEREVDPRHELAAVVKRSQAESDLPLLFRRVRGSTLPVVSNLYGSPQGEALAQRIVDNSFADTVFFTNSGVEAIECAIKTARRYHDVTGHPERYKLITFKNAFHGRSLEIGRAHV